MKVWPSSDRLQLRNSLAAFGMRRRLGNAAGVRIDRRALGREEGLDRRAVALLGPDDVVEQRRDLHLAAHQRIGERRARGIEHRLGRRLLRPVILAEHLALEHDARPGRAAGRADDLADLPLPYSGLVRSIQDFGGFFTSSVL